VRGGLLPGPNTRGAVGAGGGEVAREGGCVNFLRKFGRPVEPAGLTPSKASVTEDRKSRRLAVGANSVVGDVEEDDGAEEMFTLFARPSSKLGLGVFFRLPWGVGGA
jgi:hypothetical protein